MSIKITIETTVNASLDDVWSAWITPDDINQWNAATNDWHNPSSTNDLRVGGRFSYRMEAKDGSMGFDFEGTYTTIIEKQLIEFDMDDERTVSIRFVSEDGQVRVIESFDAEDEHSAEQQRQGWQSILNNFAKYVELK
ncbi:MAG: SRPBCC family protein [Gammaproteobacteria bacterium]